MEKLHKINPKQTKLNKWHNKQDKKMNKLKKRTTTFIANPNQLIIISHNYQFSIPSPTNKANS